MWRCMDWSLEMRVNGEKHAAWRTVNERERRHAVPKGEDSAISRVDRPHTILVALLELLGDLPTLLLEVH